MQGDRQRAEVGHRAPLTNTPAVVGASPRSSRSQSSVTSSTMAAPGDAIQLPANTSWPDASASASAHSGLPGSGTKPKKRG
jgi:hypothetical protein